ncbi:MAG: DUF1475 domain-containing protein [Bacteroidetes bacterium]|nr:DUF1475 domain-containing protein [Bacteroidota bacterium]
MKNILITIFGFLFIYIIYTIVATSLESNLFTEWDFLASIPWMQATLIDFYINTIVIAVWVAFKEKHITKTIVWFIAFCLLGSAATTFYVLLQLFKLSADEPVSNAFLTSRKLGK